MRRDTDRLARERFDLLILGGGITGAGVALDAALRGLSVALIDKVPRPGAGGCRVAFVHPKSAGGVLLELKEA